MTTQYERIQAAARFMLEAPEGSVFQENDPTIGWCPVGADRAFYTLQRFPDRIRLRPTPKKVLRPAWEVLKMLRPEQFVYNDGGVNIGEVTIAFISQHNGSVRGFNVACLFKWAGKTRIEIGTWGIDLPEEWFTEVEG